MKANFYTLCSTSFLSNIFSALLLLLLGLNKGNAANYFPSSAGGSFHSGAAWNATTCGGAGSLSWPTTSADVVTIGACAKTITVSTTPETCGSLTINGGTLVINGGCTLTCSSLTMTSGALTVNGTLNVGNASTGGFSITGGTFSGTGTVGLTGTTQTLNCTQSFYNLNVAGAGNKTMSSNVTVTNLLTLTANDLLVGSNTLTIGSGLSGQGITKVSGLITTTSSSSLSFGGGTYNLTLGTYLSNTWPVTLTNFTMTSDLATITLGSSQSLTVSGAFNLSSGGNFAIGANTLTLNGAVTFSGSCFCNSLTGGSSSNLTLGGSGAASIYFSLSNTNAGGTNTINNLTISAARSLVMLSNLRVGGTLSMVSGASVSIAAATSSQTLTIDGSLSGANAGTFIGSSTYAYMIINGTGALGANLTFSSTLALAGFQIDRTSSGAVVLGSNLAVAGNLTMTAGTLDINNKTLDLGTTGNVMSETSTNRIFCSTCTTTTGKITSGSNTLAASTAYTNLRGLGLDITTGTTAPGSTTINRGFAAQSGAALTTGILRWYEITPATNTGLNATLNIKYWTSELNSITESTLQLFNSAIGANTWVNQAGTVNTGTHAISVGSINQFTEWTAGAGVGCSNPVVGGNTPSNPTTCGGANGSVTLTGLTASTVYGVTYNKNSTPVGSANFTSDGSGNLVIGSLGAGTYNNFVVTISTCSSSAYPSSGSIILSNPASPTAVISGTLSGCVNPGVALGTTGSSAGSGTITGYQWSNSGGPIGGATSSTYTATASSNYTVVIGNSNNCSATSTASAVTANANPTAVISGTLTGCVSPGVTLGTTGSSAGSGIISGYQWNNSGGGISGATGGTYTATVSDNYTVVITNSNNCSATSTASTVTVNNCGPFTWVGSSGDWSDPSNWSPAVMPNNCGANVTILRGAPVISVADVNVGNISINDGIVLTLNGRNLNVCDTFTGGSAGNAAVVGSGTTFINGSSAQTIIGNTQFDVLQINNGNGVALVPGAAISIATGLQLQHGQLDISNGTLTLLSAAANNNSYIDDFSSTFDGTILGNIIAQRYIPVSGSNQHFISSPLARVGLNQIGATGPDGSFIVPTGNCDETQSDQGSQYGSVFTYVDGHEPAGVCMLGNWRITTVGDMLGGVGYSAYLSGNTSIALTGSVNTGDISVTNLHNSGFPTISTLQGDPIQSGWNLVGNPYPSAINLTTSRTGSGFGNQVQIWQTSGPFAGSWQSYTIGVDANIIVPPFQGFMVRRTAPNSGSYPFYQAERTRSVSQGFFRTTGTELELDLNYNGLTDLTRVAFTAGATTGYDGAFDANKTDGKAGRPTLYTYFDNTEWYSLNSIPTLTETTAVPVGLRPEATGIMTLTPQGIESFDPTTYILLEDKQTGTWQNLRNGAYTFNTGVFDNQQRFVLHFSPPSVITTSDASCNMNGLINMAQPGNATWNYTITDANANILASGVLSQYDPVSVSAPLGIYLLTLTDNDGYTVVKNIQVGGFQQVMASFSTNSNTVQVQQPVQFTNTSNSNICTWYFGDGATATGTSVQHSYQNEGVYTINLSVTNADGCTSIATQNVTVTSRSTTGVVNLDGNNGFPIWSSDNRVFVDFSKLGNVDAQIDLYNVLGQLLSSEKYSQSTVYSRAINNMEAAYIIVRVNNGDAIETKKVFIANSK